MHCADGVLYLIDFGSAHGTSTGGCKAQPVRPQVPTPIASGTLLRFGDKNAPLFLVKYCTKQDLLGSALHRQVTHQQLQLPFTPTSPHPQPGSPPSSHGTRNAASAQPLAEQHPNPQQPQSNGDDEPPPPGAPSPKAPDSDDGMEEQDDEEYTDPLTPHTMINTQLNAVLPSFVDSRTAARHAQVKRTLEPTGQFSAITGGATKTSTAPMGDAAGHAGPSGRCPLERSNKRVCFHRETSLSTTEPTCETNHQI